MTRATYTLSGIEGPIENGPDGLVFNEKVRFLRLKTCARP